MKKAQFEAKFRKSSENLSKLKENQGFGKYTQSTGSKKPALKKPAKNVSTCYYPNPVNWYI